MELFVKSIVKSYILWAYNSVISTIACTSFFVYITPVVFYVYAIVLSWEYQSNQPIRVNRSPPASFLDRMLTRKNVNEAKTIKTEELQ